MNKIDMSFPNASWKAEGQAVKSAIPGADGGERGQESDTLAVFDSLLRRMSEKDDGAPARTQAKAVEAKSLLPSFGGIEDSDTDQGSADDLLLEQRGDGKAPLLPVPELRPAEPQINLVPTGQPAPSQPVATNAQTPSTSRDPAPALSSSSLLDLIHLSADKTKAGEVPEDLAKTSERRATVVRQEAHFKPIFLTNAPAGPKLKNQEPLLSPSLSIAGTNDETAATAESVHKDVTPPKAPVPHAARETTSQAADAKGEKDLLPSADSHIVMQRVVSAIQNEAKRAPLEQATSISRHDTSAPMLTSKQSDGVLRMLDIQLRPVELGVITVKMRLSGDKLEMELHASREETAEILRKDSEMLSNLLRTSGYRPDMVSIHTSRTDMAQPDNLLGQRQSTTPDGAAQFGSSHGGEAGQNERSRDETDEYRSSGQGGQKNGADEIAANRSSGGLYL